MVVEFFLSIVAGAATAVAATKIRSMRGPHVPTIGANSRIRSEMRTLGAQKRILEKSIARLYTDDMGLSAQKRKALLSRYQEQLAQVSTQSQRLVEASAHPDLGPLGDGLVTLMDQKLSGIEEKFGKLYAKLDSEQQAPKKPTPKAEPKPAPQRAPDATIQIPESTRRVELATLTEVPPRTIQPPIAIAAGFGTVPETPTPSPQTPYVTPEPAPYATPEPAPAPTPQVTPEPAPLAPESTAPQPRVQIPDAEPEPAHIPPRVDPPIIESANIDEEIGDTDDDSITQIKQDIQNALKKIDQAEVE